MDKVRSAAFKILNRINRDNAYSNLVLKSFYEKEDFDSRDKAFLQTLINGVLERLYTLDYNLSLYLKQPLSKLKPEIHTILRLGAFQILFLDKVPSSVAVNESVKLSKKDGLAFASGLINAVLRKITQNGVLYPDKNKDIFEYLKVKYSFPLEIIKMFYNSYGEDSTISILEHSLGKPHVFAFYNPLKTDFKNLESALLSENCEIQKIDFPNNAFLFNSVSNISSLKAFKDGLFNIQDLSSQICVSAISANPDSLIIDTCAAPGGKSFNLAVQMRNKGKLISCDVHEHKIDLIKQGADRLGIKNIEPILRDALDKTLKLPLANFVLCDVPCSGFGVSSRKPEIKYKSLDSLKTLPDLQYNILRNSSKLLKSGGILTYSTCTLNPKENEEVCKKFLEKSKDFTEIKVLPQIKRQTPYEANSLTIFPNMFNSDGFFIAQFKKLS